MHNASLKENHQPLQACAYKLSMSTSSISLPLSTFRVAVSDGQNPRFHGGEEVLASQPLPYGKARQKEEGSDGEQTNLKSKTPGTFSLQFPRLWGNPHVVFPVWPAFQKFQITSC